VIDVGVSDDDVLDLQAVTVEDCLNLGDVIAGIDNNSFMGLLVPEDRAVALEQADRENLVNHGSRVQGLKEKRRRTACVFRRC
jgi:hypothetical protein